MNVQQLAEQAAKNDLFFSSLMNKVPTFFTQHTQNLNSKYIFNRDGFAAAAYKTDKKKSKQNAMINDESDGAEDDNHLIGSDDDDDDNDGAEDGDVNVLFNPTDTAKDDSDEEMIEGVEYDDDDDVGFAAPKSYANVDILRQRLIEKSKTLYAQPKLTKVEIEQRKKKRQEKDRLAKEKGIKQKSKPSGGQITNKEAAASTADGEIAHINKKQKTTVSQANEQVHLQFAPVIQNHISKSVETAGTKHLVSKKGTIKQQLVQLEKFEGKIKSLKSSGNEELAEKLVHKQSVSTALQRAMGESVNDNVKSLKKQVKLQEKAKIKSQKVWGQRTRQTEKDLNEKLDARNLHIKKKIEHKKNKRIGNKD